jgi:hypothetical protein
MKGDSESKCLPHIFTALPVLILLLDIATATLCWMLQVISPHLTIDREAFSLSMAQYTRWLFRLRFACTYHHASIVEKAWNWLPKLPIPGFGRDELEEPPHASPHTHTNFDFSWGTGPLVDSYGGFYYLIGANQRMPGHEEVESYNDRDKAHKWTKLHDLGNTNEYIHPIAYYRSLVRGWDTHSPLKHNWNRANWETDGSKRFWWYKDGEKDKCAIPEWAILPDGREEYNFERFWYNECEKTAKILGDAANSEDFPGRDFLQKLDGKIDFAFNDRPQNLWP